MLKLIVLLHTTMVGLEDRFRARPPTRQSQRGSVTTEYVLWAVAVIAIVGIVVAAVRAYVTSRAGDIK